MRTSSTRLGVGVVACLLLGGTPFAWANRCNQVNTITSISHAADSYTDLSDSPAVICSVDFTAAVAGGFASVFDSPNDLDSHAQATIKSEPGAASAGDSRHINYGPDGRLTRFGLDVLVKGGTVIIQWSGTTP